MRIRLKKLHNIPLKISFFIYLFLFVFKVDFCRYDTHLLLFLFGIIIILTTTIHRSAIIIPKSIKEILSCFIPYFLYITIAMFVHIITDPHNYEIYVNHVYSMFFIFLQISVMCYVIFWYETKLGLTLDDYINYLVRIGIVQTICVLLALLFANVREAFNQLTISFGQSEHMINYVIMNNQRSFGLADNLFDSFGYTTSILITLSFLKGVNGEKKYLFFFFPMLVMPLVNTRTGLMLVGISVLIALIYFYKEVIFRDLHWYILGIVALILGGRIALNYINQDTIDWVIKGLNSVSLFLFSGETTGSMASLNQSLILPDGLLECLYGMGATIEDLGLGNADIGYIRLIWSSGVFGMLLILSAFAVLFRRCYKITYNKMYKCLILCISAIFFVYLYKLYSIGNMCGNILVFSIIMFYLNQKKKPLNIIHEGKIGNEATY